MNTQVVQTAETAEEAGRRIAAAVNPRGAKKQARADPTFDPTTETTQEAGARIAAYVNPRSARKAQKPAASVANDDEATSMGKRVAAMVNRKSREPGNA